MDELPDKVKRKIEKKLEKKRLKKEKQKLKKKVKIDLSKSEDSLMIKYRQIYPEVGEDKLKEYIKQQKLIYEAKKKKK